MRSRPRSRAATAAGLAALLLAPLAGCGGEAPPAAPPEGPSAPPPAVDSAVVPPASLYFPGPQDTLEPEERQLPPSTDPRDQVVALLTALLEGPQDPRHAAPLPADVSLGGVVLSSDGTAFVDLRSTDLPSPPDSGSTTELLRVYSVVNTVLLGVPEVRAVVLLWNGEQRPSFAGHVDTGHALAARPELLEEPP